MQEPFDPATLTNRYTLQWLKHSGTEFDDYGHIYPVNSPLAFIHGDASTNPHPVLLDYVYGGAAIMAWADRPTVSKYKERVAFEPPVTPTILGPPKKRRTSTDRALTAAKRNPTLSPPYNSTSPGRGISLAEAEDVMMSLAMRSPTAHQYARQIEEEERTRLDRVRNWLAGWLNVS